MRTILLYSLIILISQNLLSQNAIISGKVIGESGPIPYATVSSLDYSVGIYTNEFGNFELDTSQMPLIDSVLFEALGFKSIKLSIIELIHRESVYLEEEILDIPIVEIKSKRMRSYKIGTKSRRPDYVVVFDSISWNAKIGRSLKIPKGESGLIENISVFIASSGVPATPFRLRFFKLVHKKDRLQVGAELVLKSIIGRGIQKNKWLTVDVSEHNIPITDQGVLVSIEWLYDKSVKYQYKRLQRVQKDGEWIIQETKFWGSSFGVEKTKKGSLWWTCTNGIDWESNKKNTNLFQHPMMKASVRY